MDQLFSVANGKHFVSTNTQLVGIQRRLVDHEDMGTGCKISSIWLVYLFIL